MARRIFTFEKFLKKIKRFLIGLLSYIDHDVYMRYYIKFLRRYGMHIESPIYIGNTTRFDGKDFSLITICDRVVISSEVLFLTHDYSISRVYEALTKSCESERFEVGEIYIGENCFIGARATILPNTRIGHDSIIGACAVVKGKIEPFSIIIGNPGRKIGDVREGRKN